MDSELTAAIDAFDYTYVAPEAKAMARMFYLTAYRLVEEAPGPTVALRGLERLLELRNEMCDAFL